MSSNPGDKDKEMEMTAEENAEFSDTLKSLETTMRLHMTALSVKRGLVASDGGPVVGGPMGQAPPPRSLSRLRRESTKINGGAAMPNRTDKVIVYVRIMFLKVGEIDTLRDKFSADAFIQSKWREPAMDGKLRLQNEDINWEIYWNPKLSVENVFGDPKENVWYSVSFDGTGQATVCEKRRVNGSFLEFMELNQFPFDSQDLTVTLTTDRDESEIEFVEDPKEKCSLNVQSFVDEQEWKLHKYIHTWTKTREEAFRNTQAKHPAFSAACKASRRPQFFIWNILVVMFLICSLSFATFSVAYNLPQNRLQLTFILLLTTVSFKFVVNQSLPMIAYLTYLDKYILGSMAILATICVWHAFIPFVNSTIIKCQPDRVALADMIAFGILATIYIAFHLGLLCAIACLAKENSIYDKGDATMEHGRGNFGFEDDYEENGNIPEMFHDKLDVKAIRKQNASEQTTNQQTVMSAWQ